MGRQPIDFDELLRDLTRQARRGSGSSSSGDDDGDRPPSVGLPTRGIWLFLVPIGLLMAWMVGVSVVTEWWWFDSVGQRDVYQTRLVAPLALFGVLSLVGALWLVANWLWAAGRVASEAQWPGQRAPIIAWLGMRAALTLGAVALAAVIAAGASGAWERVLLYLSASEFGLADPIFDRDISFYIYDLPLWQMLHGVAWTWLMAAFAGTVGVYVLGGVLQLRGGALRVVGHARAHLAILAALGALLWGAGHWLGRFDLLYGQTPTGSFYGAGYADIQARLPGLQALVLLSGLVAAAFLVSIRSARLWLPAGAVAVAIGAQIVAVQFYPSFVQQFQVTPNELERERPYIAHNIDLTREAFGLSGVQEADYQPRGSLSADLFEEHADTINNIRLWDWRALRATFRQLQEIRPYYEFLDVDVDRYELDSGTRQVLLSARELAPADLPNRTWVNLHLKFTHGHGVVITPVDEVTPQGLPQLWAQDIPVTTRAPFNRTITEPRVYFGENTNQQYVVVNTPGGEFSYSAEGGDVRTQYEGADGVVLNSALRRLLFASRVGDIELLLSDEVTRESRILLRRDIIERVRTLAPFLVLDSDPYLVVSPDGRLKWFIDAYTTSRRFPYSKPSDAVAGSVLNGANYVRNSVKVVVDAYDGRPQFYVVDPDDPLIQTWQEVYPSLFLPAEDLSEGLRAHWRYPEALFSVQAATFTKYHMADADEFYNAEDLWVVPTESFDQGGQQLMEPYYVTMRLRGEPAAEFLLMLPFTPSNKQNLTAWMAARSDPPHYGELVVYRFATGQQFYGPQQIESRIDQDTDISQQLTLWSQSGSRVIRGNLLIIPIGDALMYVEPLYLRADEGENALPELKRVIVADNERVVMRTTLDEALEALLADEASLEELEAPTGVEAPIVADREEVGEPSEGQPGSDVPGDLDALTLGDLEDADIAGLVREARAREAAAARALADRDWQRFGEEMDALQRTLNRLALRTGADAEPDDEQPDDADPGVEGADASESDDGTGDGGTGDGP